MPKPESVQPRPSARVHQVRTGICSPVTVMRHPNFARGLADIRAGLPFADDADDHLWAYERGRLFGAIAPRSMQLFDGKQLNPKALNLFSTAVQRRLIP